MCPVSILFEPDGYDIQRSELVGRAMAGYGFLKAAVGHCDPARDQLSCYTARKQSAEVFTRLVRELSPGLETVWTQTGDVESLAQIGTLYLADPNLDRAAQTRLRAGPGAYSLVGVTHTTATHAIMDMVRNLYMAPVMPWDALVCTSLSVRSMVQSILEAQADYAAWRFGAHRSPPLCQLPVIPLGIHLEEFAGAQEARPAARRQLGIEDDELVVLYIGRFSPYTKANPLPMYVGLQAAAERTKQKIVLLECGWYINDLLPQQMEAAHKSICPDVRCLVVDGRDQARKFACLAAADIFTSLSDNIQETFGLTPVEAMAAGLPVVVSAWDGYRELLEDGVQGFQVPTMMLDDTALYADLYDSGMPYGRYCASVAQVTAVDTGIFADRIATLALDAGLRKRMGAAGRALAAERYDWRKIYKQYDALWQELAAVRQKDAGRFASHAPARSPGRLPPSTLFHAYPTHLLTDDTGLSVADPRMLRFWDDPLLNIGRQAMPQRALAEALMSELSKGQSLSARDLAGLLSCDLAKIKRLIAILVKLGALKLTG